MADAQVTAYPLQWPEGWPRTSARIANHPFGSRTYELTFERARRQLFEELQRLGASNIVLSSNLPIRVDGGVYSDVARRRIGDPGVAVYFSLKHRQMVMAQDRYVETAANVRSLGLAIEGMRQLDRHGGGHMMERAFAGFVALPSAASWKSVLGFNAGEPPSRQQVNDRWRALASERHPDKGGSTEAMSELNRARDQALKEIGA